MTQHVTPGAGAAEAIGRQGLADALDEAATAALRAPSIFNMQPWTWRIEAGTLELRADPDGQLVDTGPEGRMLVISCGIALHHAVTALATLDSDPAGVDASTAGGGSRG